MEQHFARAFGLPMNVTISSCVSSSNSTPTNATTNSAVSLLAPGDNSQEIFGQYSSYIAVGIVFAAAILSGVAGVVQKLAHRNSRGRQFCPRPLRGKSCALMVVGITLTIIAMALDLAALMFGNITLVAPLGTLKLVVIAILSAMCYRQTLHVEDWLIILGILTGCALTVYFSVPRTCIFTLSDIEALYTRLGVIIYASIVGAIIVGVLLFLAIVRQIEKRHGTDSAQYRALKVAHRNAYPLCAGMVGAQSVLFAKALVEIITDYTIVPAGSAGVDPSWQYIWFAMGAGVVFFIALQIYLINEGLSRFNAISQLPVFQCTWTLWSVIGGAVFYVEMREFQFIDFILYPVGVVLVLVGFVVLELRRERFIQRQHRSSADRAAVKLLEGYGSFE